MTRLVALAFASSLALAALPARAQDDARAAALDAEATTLMEARRFEEACPKLAASDRLKPGTGVVMRLGLCYERVGKTASAWSAYRVAATRAELAGDVTLKELATKRADALEPRLPSLRLKLPAGVDAEVKCDGVAIDAATLRAGTIHLDPGSHVIEASAPARRAFRATFIAEVAASTTIAVDMPILEAPPVAHEASSRRPLVLVAAGVGVAGIAIGSVLGMTAATKWSRAKSECASAPTGCSADALDLEQTVRTDARWATVAFGVGAIGIAGAAVLWLTAPNDARETRARETRARVSPMVARDVVGVVIGARF